MEMLFVNLKYFFGIIIGHKFEKYFKNYSKLAAARKLFKMLSYNLSEYTSLQF